MGVVKEISTEAQLLLSHRNLTSSNLVEITGEVMALVQKRGELKGLGQRKKRIVQTILQELLDAAFFDEEAKAVSIFIVNTLPATIDMLKTLSRTISTTTVDFKKCCF
jgi:hypothetical protein